MVGQLAPPTHDSDAPGAAVREGRIDCFPTSDGTQTPTPSPPFGGFSRRAHALVVPETNAVGLVRKGRRSEKYWPRARRRLAPGKRNSFSNRSGAVGPWPWWSLGKEGVPCAY
jgi:hypothetical protein